jgi:small-conductance mechanosensitive channel
VTSIPSDQDLRSATVRTLCVETAPAVLVAAGVVYTGVVSAEWWVYLLALLPAVIAGRHVHRTLQVERRYAMFRWLAAETRWRKRQAAAAVAELEDGDPNRMPSVVDGSVAEARA